MITLTTRNTDCPDFKYDPHNRNFNCKVSPNGSKVILSHGWWFSQTYLLEITPGSSVDIRDLKDTSRLAWFPDSKRIAYLRSLRCDHEHHNGECCDLVVQCLASGQITTIHRWYNIEVLYYKVFVTPDGASLVITHKEGMKSEFRTWDVSD
ncbi:hypothetical protein ARMGADRAFT_1115380 [Armillaria gallica]|uniref:Dipeptidylpeptidase IV N-terminal domain-containing protein n=1 Tax=Armillaria gallica TaxID=47427 RepID=A0A2H3DJ62_ARMGA|nr:hypothetical protein ARMGADRAFT_1115380 [Armillaria gallica]